VIEGVVRDLRRDRNSQPKSFPSVSLTDWPEYLIGERSKLIWTWTKKFLRPRDYLERVSRGQQSGWATIRKHKLASQKIRREARTDRLARKSGGGHPHLIVTTTRRLGVCPTGIVAITLLVRVSIAETVLEVELLTKRRSPLG